jgi:hypothetical protein
MAMEILDCQFEIAMNSRKFLKIERKKSKSI